MKLRPHHLLCTLGYVGLGYNDEFVANMNFITTELKKENVEIILYIGTDDICISCPKKIDEDICIENNSVISYDKKVLEVFNLVEKKYEYEKIIDLIKKEATFEKLNYICGDCSWFDSCITRKKLGC